MIFARILCLLEFKVNKRLLINIYSLANCIIEYLQIIYASTITKKVMVSKFSAILLFSWIFPYVLQQKATT